MMFLSLLALSASLEFGFIDGGVVQYKPEVVPSYSIPFYSTFEIQAQTKYLYFGSSVRTEMFPANVFSWTPTQVTYNIKTGLIFEHFVFGYEHSCFHPIMPYATTMIEERQVVPSFEGYYDRFYVRMEISSKRNKIECM